MLYMWINYLYVITSSVASMFAPLLNNNSTASTLPFSIAYIKAVDPYYIKQWEREWDINGSRVTLKAFKLDMCYF
jgi:hypothetical protein